MFFFLYCLRLSLSLQENNYTLLYIHMLKRLTTTIIASALLVNAMAQIAEIQPSKELLDAKFGTQDERNFLTPPKVFWPETWFHFIRDNISREGIDADLEAISSAGIAGIQWFHGSFGDRWPKVNNPIVPLSKEWDDIVGYMAHKARSLDLRLTIQTCPGWAMAGGPWITPENAMRDLVCSRIDVDAGSAVDKVLEKGAPSKEDWRDYRDICVMAFPTPLGNTGKQMELTDVTSNTKEWTSLLKGENKEDVFAKEGGIHSVRFKTKKGEKIRTLQLSNISKMNLTWVYDPGVDVCLDALMPDGSRKTVLRTAIPMANWQDYCPIDLAVDEIDANNFELTISNKHDLWLTFVRLYSDARMNDWQGKMGITLRAKESSAENVKQSPETYININNVRDITSSMTADGHLRWTAPEGKGSWTVLRFGHVNSGRQNGPAPKEATGWECNKFDTNGADVQFNNYVGRLQRGPMEGLASGMLMDSWECVNQSWTKNMESEFEGRSGYALRSWMPALAGYVMGSQETTRRFLTDWRRTISGLYNENFFKRMTDLAHEQGLDVQYETAGSDVVAMDPLEYYKYADVPMCEFWHPITKGYVGDIDFKAIKPTASAAHIYGKRRVAAESFTSFDLSWDEHWEMLKEVANLNMTSGVTHNVFHTYTHNPQIGFLPPGTSFGNRIGTPFLRGQTWWKYMPQLTRYLARTSYMLERGLPVMSVLWYIGDEILHRPKEKVCFPSGYKYDYCNTDVLLHRLSVVDGKLRTEEGIEYDMLWIPENERMLPETLTKLRELIEAGAKVMSEAPKSIATLRGGSEAEELFDNQVKSIWNGNNGVTRMKKGCIASGMTLDETLEAFEMKPHLIANGGEVMWTERKTDGAHWFYITAPIGGEFHGTLLLKAQGMAEAWDAVSGKTSALQTTTEGEYQKVDLDLVKAENIFIVFREKSNKKATKKLPIPSKSIDLEEWTLTFPEGWGAPTKGIKISKLCPWKDLEISDEGKAFSGTVTYQTTFNMTDGMVGKDVILNLGKVDMIADVKINGKPAGILWASPYKMAIGDKLKKGVNEITIDVTSTWFNRLAYDAKLPEAERKTWTIAGPSEKSELRDSGLIGPVSIEY